MSFGVVKSYVLQATTLILVAPKAPVVGTIKFKGTDVPGVA